MTKTNAQKLISFSSLEVDTEAESNGEWVAVGSWVGLNRQMPFTAVELPGLEFHVRSINDPAYKLLRQEAIEEIEKTRDAYPDKVIPDEAYEAVQGRVIAQGLLLGWRGLDMPYTPETALEALQRPGTRHHRAMITYCAAQVGKRELAFVEDTAKN